MDLPLLYAFLAFLVPFALYRPFVTRLDRVRYGVICLAAFLLPINSHFEISNRLTRSMIQVFLWATKGIDMDDLVDAWGVHSVGHLRLSAGPCDCHSPEQSVSQMFRKSFLFTFLAASAVTMCNLITRWDLPIMNIQPGSPGYYYRLNFKLARWGGVLFCLFISMYERFGFALDAAPLLALVWYLSCEYFCRRRRELALSMVVPTLAGLACGLPSWRFIDWLSFSGLVVLASAWLDHWDALLHFYPYYAVKLDPASRATIQNPCSLAYIRALFTLAKNCPDETKLAEAPVIDMITAMRYLGNGQRSWQTMSILFPANLREDLCMLYAWFRLCDDLVDDVFPKEERMDCVRYLREFLYETFRTVKNPETWKVAEDIWKNEHTYAYDPTLPELPWLHFYRRLGRSDARFCSILRCFARQAYFLSPDAAFRLTDAFEWDIKDQPLVSSRELQAYAATVSGTFAELCTCVIMFKTGHGNWSEPDKYQKSVLKQARATGQCLQLINIARDVIADTLQGRCYIPLQFMSNTDTYYILKKSRNPQRIGEDILKRYALKILDLAERLKAHAYRGIDSLPYEVQDVVRAAFEIYQAIGPALRAEKGFPLRVKVPKEHQQAIAFSCIYGVRSLVGRAVYSAPRRLLKLVAQKAH